MRSFIDEVYTLRKDLALPFPEPKKCTLARKTLKENLQNMHEWLPTKQEMEESMQLEPFYGRWMKFSTSLDCEKPYFLAVNEKSLRDPQGNIIA